MIKIETNKGESNVEMSGYGSDILVESIIIVKILLDNLSKESKIVGHIFKTVVEESVFNDSKHFEKMPADMAILMEQLTERRLQDEE